MIEEEDRNLVMDDVDLDDSSDDDDFSSDFKNYKSTKLNWRRLKPMNAWVFWREDAMESESPPTTHSSSGVPNSAAKTLIANGKVIDKIISVIWKLIIDCERFKSGVLIQLWALKTDGDRCVLTTVDQPFGLCKTGKELCEFRMMCMKYKFYVDAKSADDPELLGHVFRQNELAFTPDVRFYTSEEYSQRCDALESFVRTSMAFPVIEPSTRCCVGVLEILTTEVIWLNKYLRVNNELQDEGLKSSDAYGHTFTVNSKAHNQVLEEISKGMKVVCETHKLLLGQTWVPCRCCRDVELGGSCSMCYAGCKGRVMSTIGCEQASYALNEDSCGFVDSCANHFLRARHGVGGRALLSCSPCFCEDVTQFSKTEYPLVHLARMYGLTSCFAICLRSTYTEDADYVIEFFLPQNKKRGRIPRSLLCSILATMKQHFQSFKVASGQELGQELSIDVFKVSKDRRPGDSFELCQITISTPTLALRNVRETVQLDSTNQQLMVEADATNNERNVAGPEQNNSRDVIYSKNNGFERKRNRRNEISYEDLEKCFGMQLEDAAKSIKVSRSTFKRACRDHGINRWKRGKKMKRKGSLNELNQVIEAVQRAEETVHLTVAVSAQRMVIENEGTSHHLRNLCHTSTAVEACQEGLDLELPVAAMTMAPAPGLEPDGVISTQLEASVEGALTLSTGSTLDSGNLSPAAKARVHDLEQEFLQELLANPFVDGHFLTVQPEMPLEELPIESVANSRDANILLTNLLSGGNFPTVQPETLVRRMLIENVESTRDIERYRPSARDAFVVKETAESSSTNYPHLCTIPMLASQTLRGLVQLETLLGGMFIENVRVIFKLEVQHVKDPHKVMKSVCNLIGIDSVAMDKKDSELTLVGDVNPVIVVCHLQKKCQRYARILSVQPEKKHGRGH